MRTRIRERGFTQLEVQEVLGWGRSYISQLVTRANALRVEQVLLILGVDPAEFFAELCGQRGAPYARPSPVRCRRIQPKLRRCSEGYRSSESCSTG